MALYILDDGSRTWTSAMKSGAIANWIHRNADGTYGVGGDADYTGANLGAAKKSVINLRLDANDKKYVDASSGGLTLTGTSVTATFDSTTVTGVGTSFTTELAVGDLLEFNDTGARAIPDSWFIGEVVSIGSNTALSLKRKYLSATKTGTADRLRGATSNMPTFQQALVHLAVDGRVPDVALAVMGINDSPGDWAFIALRKDNGTGIAIDDETSTSYCEHFQGLLLGTSGVGLHLKTDDNLTNLNNILVKLEELGNTSSGNRALDVVARSLPNIILRRRSASGDPGIDFQTMDSSDASTKDANLSMNTSGQLHWTGDSFKITKATGTITAPAAGVGALRWETGTNAGTLKLVAYSGTSTTGTTVIDNVGSGN